MLQLSGGLNVTNIVVEFPELDGHEDEVGGSVNLNAVSIALQGIEYEPEHFSGAIYRSEADETCLLFSSGGMIVQGSESTREAVERKTKLFDQLSSYGLLE